MKKMNKMINFPISQMPASQAVYEFMLKAIKSNASDLHFDPQGEHTRVRLRINGIMRTIDNLDPEYYRLLEYEFKGKAGIAGAERMPKSKRIDFNHEGKNHSFRFESAHNYLHDATKITMRYVSDFALNVTLDQLGFTENDLSILTNILNKNTGILLVSGPTGSGKTTTLYSAIKHINHDGIHILAVEDPAEAPIPGVNQIEVRDNVSFPTILKSALRQDPDVILVGEIRDGESAETAVNAAMTGHLVLTSIHANSALSTIIKLVNFGVDRHNIISALRGVMAQRLVPKLCPHCKIEKHAKKQTRFGLEMAGLKNVDLVWSKGKGCEVCDHTGYLGRTMLYELYGFEAFDKHQLHKVLKDGDDIESLKDHFKKNYQTRPMADHAMEMMVQGIISAEDALGSL